MVAHLSTNRARHILTLLIEANALPTMPDQCDQRGEFQPKCSSSSVFWSLTSQMGRLYCWTEVQCSEVTVVEKYKFYVCLILDIWALVFRLVESTSIDYQVCFFDGQVFKGVHLLTYSEGQMVWPRSPQHFYSTSELLGRAVIARPILPVCRSICPSRFSVLSRRMKIRSSVFRIR